MVPSKTMPLSQVRRWPTCASLTAMPDPEPSITDTLRALIAEEPRSLKQLALDANVPYQVVQKWTLGEVTKLDVGVAEKLYLTLTGKTFDNGL